MKLKSTDNAKESFTSILEKDNKEGGRWKLKFSKNNKDIITSIKYKK